MAARSYKLNADDARQGDAGGNRIDRTGSYKGVFTEAKAVLSAKKTEGIELTFESEGGQEARYLTLWTHNAQGQPIYGDKQLQALMTCMSLKEFSESPGMVKEYIDGKMQEVQGTVFPALVNTPVGVVFQKSLYTKNNGEDGEKMEMVAFFNAESGKTATEILDKNEAKTIATMLRTLDEVRDNRRAVSSPTSTTDSGSQSALDDDIVF